MTLAVPPAGRPPSAAMISLYGRIGSRPRVTRDANLLYVVLDVRLFIRYCGWCCYRSLFTLFFLRRLYHHRFFFLRLIVILVLPAGSDIYFSFQLRRVNANHVCLSVYTNGDTRTHRMRDS